MELLPFAKDGPKKLLVVLPQGLGYPQALSSPGNTQQELPGQLMVFIFTSSWAVQESSDGSQHDWVQGAEDVVCCPALTSV